MNIIILIIFLVLGCKTSSSSSSLVDSEVKSVSTESGQTTTQTDTQTTVKKTISQDPSKVMERTEEYEIIPIPGKAPISVLKNRKTKITDIGKKATIEDTEKNIQLQKQAELIKQKELDDKLKKEAALAKSMAPSVGCAFTGWLYIVVILVAILGIAIPILRKFADKLPFPLNLLGKSSKE